VIHRRQRVRARAHSRIEERDVIVGKAKSPTEPLAEEVGDQMDLAADDLDGRVVDPVITAELWIVGREEIFVKVQPGIAATPQEIGRVESLQGSP
jgi:hypothetical protein